MVLWRELANLVCNDGAKAVGENFSQLAKEQIGVQFAVIDQADTLAAKIAGTRGGRDCCR
jgi:hypothetical protein